MEFTHVFLHGRLLDPQHHEELLGRKHLFTKPAQAKWWKSEEVSGYPCLVPDMGIVDGAVSIMGEEELRILDETKGCEGRLIDLVDGSKAWACCLKRAAI